MKLHFNTEHYPQEIQWIEYFAGLGNLSSMMRASHYASLRFDIIDHNQESHRSSNYMDFTHSSGFGFLGTCFTRLWESCWKSPLPKKTIKDGICTQMINVNLGFIRQWFRN